MRNLLVGASALCLLIATASQAAIMSVAGPQSSYGAPPPSGAPPQIIGAPGDVSDDAAFNFGMQGFNEQQSFTLLAPLPVDGGSIAAGTIVDSHMIFLNTGPGNSGTSNAHRNVTWTFAGAVLGVMSDVGGTLEAASSGFLGAGGTIYPAAFPNRGLESNDSLSVFGNTVTVSMFVTEPGDWIRVVTATVPEPTSALVFSGLLGIAVLTQRRRRWR